MAFPTILVDSATGSDSLASGAGPTTALTGSSASTDGTGLVVTLDGSPDLSGVATDGSHCLYLADSTAGKRNFGRITGVDNTAKTVTVDTAFSLSASGLAWALGGTRASVMGSAASRKLIENNATAGDAMPGWVTEMQSGHAESYNATMTWRRSGSSANGPITLRGASGAATRPVLTWTQNGNAFEIANTITGLIFEDFEMQNTNATKTGSSAFFSSGHFLARRLKIAHSTNKFAKACTNGGSSMWASCEIGYCANVGIGGNTSGFALQLTNCWIHDCGSHGVTQSDGWINAWGTIFSSNAGDGVNVTSGTAMSSFINCAFVSNTGDGVEITSANGPIRTIWLNNIFASNGGYGINFSQATWTGGTDAAYRHNFVRGYGNNFYNNTSGGYRTGFPSENETTSDPQFTNAAAGDFSIGSNLASQGWPVGGSQLVGQFSSTSNYSDPGPAQRQPSGGGGSGGCSIIGGGIVRSTWN